MTERAAPSQRTSPKNPKKYTSATHSRRMPRAYPMVDRLAFSTRPSAITYPKVDRLALSTRPSAITYPSVDRLVLSTRPSADTYPSVDRLALSMGSPNATEARADTNRRTEAKGAILTGA